MHVFDYNRENIIAVVLGNGAGLGNIVACCSGYAGDYAVRNFITVDVDVKDARM